MKEFKEFIKQLRTKFQKDLKSQGKNNFVFGNQSCDMDSVISSIFLAFFMTQKNDQKNYFPVINFQKKYFKHKLDINKVLKDIDISPDDLIYYEELKKEDFDQCKIYMVDFNKFNKNEEFLQEKVCGIYDHHSDESEEKDLEFKVIELRGSAVSIVIEKNMDFIKKNDVSFFAKQLMAPLYIDTYLFDEDKKDDKYVDKDEEIRDYFKDKYNLKNDYYKELMKLKDKCFDIEQQGFDIVLEFDLKQYFEKNGYHYVITSMMSNAEKIIDKIGFEKFEKDIQNLQKEKKADNILVCFNYIQNDKQTRQVYFADNKDNKKIIEYLQDKDIIKDLNKDQRLYEIYDSEMSRKKFQPKIHEFLKDYLDQLNFQNQRLSYNFQ